MSRLFAFAIPVLLAAFLGCFRPADVQVAQNEQAVAVVPDDPIIVTRVDDGDGDGKLPVAPFPHEPGEIDLTTEDPGIEAPLPLIERLDLPLPGVLGGPNPFTGQAPRPDALVPLPELPPPLVNPVPLFPGRGDSPVKVSGAFSGRIGATKQKLLRQDGGSEASEKAVEFGLAWLAKQQQKDGGWEFDKGSKDNRAAATGLVLLAFLGAGETHKDPKGKYRDVVKNGLVWLTKMTPAGGPNAGRISTNMYEHAIGTIALCEAYGMTKDPTLRPYAQAAINYIQRSQGPNGSWGYGAQTNGDTSIVGWQIQALQAARLSKDLVVDDRVIKRAVKFLDLAAGGEEKSKYGYTDNTGALPGTALTASGLWSRACIDDWTPKHPGMIDGVEGLVKKTPPLGKGEVRNLYYYYYATQVVRSSGGENWKNWNEGPKAADGTRKGGMRDWLVGAQVKKEGENLGSWDPEAGWFGTSCGRVGTTAMCLLTLEVYYRHLPSEKKGDDPK